MATVKVSALTALTNTDGAEEVLINDGGTSKKVTIANLLHDNSLDSKHYIDGSIDTAHIADNAITSAKLGVDVIVAEDIANNAITVAELANNAVTTVKILDDNVTAAKLANSINTDIATGVTGNTTANAALPKAGGAMTGAITTNSTFDGVDVAAASTLATNAMPKGGGAFSGAVTTNSTFDGVDIATRDGVLTSTTATAAAALPKAGGTMTGNIAFGDNVRAKFGASDDLQIWHDSSNSYISDGGTGDLHIEAADNLWISNKSGEKYIRCIADGAIDVYHNNVVKLSTTATGVTVTGGAVGTMTTDNDGSFAMSASNNFKCTPAGNFALTFTAIVAQSGNILFINSGGHTISAHANTKVDATLLATISTAGTYLLAYFSDGTNVYMTNSAAYA